MNNLMLENSVGSGVLFPIELVTEKGLVTWKPVIGDIALIQNNVTAILLYQIGFRFREEYFGTRVWETLDEPNTQLLTFLVKKFLTSGILSWEPRVELLASGVKITQSDSKLHIHITYMVIATKNVSEISFFYNPNTSEIYVDI